MRLIGYAVNRLCGFGLRLRLIANIANIEAIEIISIILYIIYSGYIGYIGYLRKTAQPHNRPTA